MAQNSARLSHAPRLAFPDRHTVHSAHNGRAAQTEAQGVRYQRYDLIFDAVRKRTFSDCRRALKPEGIYVTTELSPSLMLQKQWVSMTGSQKLVPLPLMRPDNELMLELKELLESGKVTPVIDRRYTLNEVPEALAYLGKGHARGKVVITV